MRAVTAILCRGDSILLLRRSLHMPTMPGLWSAVSGTIEGDEDIMYRMHLEIYEETGIKHVRTLSSCSLRITDDIWLYSVLCAACGDVMLNSENTSYRWIRPADIISYDTVPALNDILFLLLGSIGALTGEHYVYAGTATHRTWYVVSGMLACPRVYEGCFFRVY